jgi:hypothetical protein
MNEVDAVTLQVCLSFMYKSPDARFKLNEFFSSHLDVFHSLLGLWEVSSLLQIPDLVKIAESHVIAYLHPTNITSVREIASRHQRKVFLDQIITPFIAWHLQTSLSEYQIQNLTEDEVFWFLRYRIWWGLGFSFSPRGLTEEELENFLKIWKKDALTNKALWIRVSSYIENKYMVSKIHIPYRIKF